MELKEAYRILEANETESLETIKKKYHKLIKVYHPDENRNINTTEKVQELNIAYDTIYKHMDTKKETNKNNTHQSKAYKHNFYNNFYKREEKRQKEKAREVEIEKIILKLKESRKQLEREYSIYSLFDNISFLDWLKIMFCFQKVADKVGTTRIQLYKEYTRDCVFSYPILSFDIWLEQVLLFDSYAKRLGTTRERLKEEYEVTVNFLELDVSEWLEAMLKIDKYAKMHQTTRIKILQNFDVFMEYLFKEEKHK